MISSKMIRNTSAFSRHFWPMSKSNAYSTEATFEFKNPFKLHRIEKGPENTVTCTKEDALKMYRQMQGIRRLETMAGNLYKEHLVRGFCHLYSGQEACAVGMHANMTDVDSIITSYRSHGWTYLMTGQAYPVFAELIGRKKGISRGRGGSMHMYHKNFYGGNGIVGAQIPLGTGIALAHKYKGNGGMSLALYGDGAANQGQLNESYNMAQLWKLPCVFVCENNGYGMGTSNERASANLNYYTKGDTCPGIWVDGMDVLAVREATRFARQLCSDGKGPVLLETATYRYSGHSVSDPGTSYRTRDEVAEVRKTRDPITGFKSRLIEAGLVTEQDIKKVDSDVKAEIDKAVKEAKATEETELDELATDIYAENLGGLVRNIVSGDYLEHKNVGPQVNK